MTRFKVVFLPIFAVLSLIVFFLVTSLYPDFLWFQSFGFGSIWQFVFKAKLGAFFGGAFLTFLWLNFHISKANRIAKNTTSSGGLRFETPFPFLNQLLASLAERQNAAAGSDISAKVYGVFLKIGAVFLSLIMGLIVKSWWQDIYAFIHQVSFAVQDPLFGRDIGFYFFTFPLLQHVQGLLMFLMFVTVGVCGWIYLSKNLLLLIFSSDLRNTQIKTHVFCLVGFFLLVFGFGVYLDIFEVLYSTKGIVFGAGFTDIHVSVPYLKLLCGLIVIEALLFFVFAFRAGFMVPLFGGALVLVVMFLGGGLIPSVIQNYVVSPNELAKEKSFIEHNIQFTRQAYDLDQIQEESFPVNYTLTPRMMDEQSTTLDNIRLWNKEPLKLTFGQLQEIRLYYEFFNIDVDRYLIDGKLQQVMLSPREIDVNQLPEQAQTWINRHLVYTHGYGICMSPVSQVTTEGLPEFYIKDIPPVSSVGLDVVRPEIYFGERTNDYMITNTKQSEFDYPRGDTNEYTHYRGKGGIQLDSLLKRLVYAFKFSDIKVFISSLITSESRVLYNHQITTVVRTLAPFLFFDQDPYLVLSDEGRLVWLLDAYTTSNRYPYSEPFKGQVNYIRNAVKVTLDAYDGSVNFYVVDAEDPVIQTYSKIYPGMFQSFDQMPVDLKRHIRYPKDLFTVQSAMYCTYHMQDPQVFYNREDVWSFPQETYEESEQVMDAYYMVTQLPGDPEPSFLSMMPFTPTNKHNMIAWMGAKCDLDSYGQLRVYKFPKEKTIYGPMQIESRIDQDTYISQKLTLWGQGGSRVIRGNMMVVPIVDSLIYVEPIYLQATQSKLPELKQVIFSYKDQVVMKRTLDQSIAEVFEREHSQAALLSPVNKASESLPEVIDELIRVFGGLSKGESLDWTKLGQKMGRAQTLVQKLELLRKK